MPSGEGRNEEGYCYYHAWLRSVLNALGFLKLLQVEILLVQLLHGSFGLFLFVQVGWDIASRKRP